jgi:hypothetical protein
MQFAKRRSDRQRTIAHAFDGMAGCTMILDYPVPQLDRVVFNTSRRSTGAGQYRRQGERRDATEAGQSHACAQSAGGGRMHALEISLSGHPVLLVAPGHLPYSPAGCQVSRGSTRTDSDTATVVRLTRQASSEPMLAVADASQSGKISAVSPAALTQIKQASVSMGCE